MKKGPLVAALGQSDERAVVTLATGGDNEAFSELVRRRQSWLRNLLRRLCRDHALADDLAQQVFLQAWRALRTLRSANAFGAWLRRLAVNAWLAHVRSGASVDGNQSGASDQEVIEPAVMDGQHQLDLDRALARLSDDERLCVVLAYSEGMSHGEISAATGLALGTVKSHIRRGSERLRTLLHGYEPVETYHVR